MSFVHATATSTPRSNLGQFIASKVTPAVVAGVAAYNQAVFDESQINVPVRTGELKDSGKQVIEPQANPGRLAMVHTTLNCTLGATALAVQSGSYAAGAAGASTVTIATAMQTINRSGTAGTVLSPVINSRSADTVVVVPDGQTVVIGGLMENNKQGADYKIPILGDIPLIGNLFKRQTKNYTKTELIVFLTPHIVAAPEQLAALSASERANSTLMPKAFTEQELDRFLDTVPVKGAKNNTANSQSLKGQK